MAAKAVSNAFPCVAQLNKCDWSSALILNGCPTGRLGIEPRNHWSKLLPLQRKQNVKLCSCLNKSCCCTEFLRTGCPKNRVLQKRGCPNVKQFIITSPIQMVIFQGIPRFCSTKSTNHPNVAGRFLPYALYALHVRIHSPKRSRGCFATAGWLWIWCRLRHPLCYWHWSEGNWPETCIFNSKFSRTNSMDPYDPYDPYGQQMAFYTC